MRRFEEPILVTRPFLPDLAEFREGLEEVWNNRWLTNDGPVVRRFQRALADYLKVPESNLALFVNGTLALELGCQAMGLSGGEVITTPFTFVATAHALKRVGATPVFADIDPETLCLDPAKVEPLITSRTKAIVPVHVFGHVCDTAGFDRLSAKYGIPVVYDAAHAIGVRVKDCNDPPLTLTSDLDLDATIGACGDMSMFSFHATKLFHSCEGGLLVFRDASLQDRLFGLRNFAIRSETSCTDVGTNAKMNELQALMGLMCLRKMPDILAKSRAIHNAYAEVLADEPKVRLLSGSANKAYVPVLFETSEMCARVYEELKTRCNVFTRRRFYPLLTDFAPYRYAQRTCPVAEDVAARILLLPTYHDLPPEDVGDIARDVLEIAAFRRFLPDRLERHQTAEILRRAVASPRSLTAGEMRYFLSADDAAIDEALFSAAREVKARCGKTEVLPRGLIETSNVCQKNCLYCGIRRDNGGVPRYRLTEAEVLKCVEEARRRGWNAVAFQSGEVESEANTAYYERLLKAVEETATHLEVTLSLGEQSEETYRRWKVAAGERVLRYLIRIETSNRELYAKLHPADHSFDRRLACIRTLKRLGYVTGSGVMIGLPGQTVEDLANDIVFFGRENLDMVGMGPYVPDGDAPLGKCRIENEECRMKLSLRMIALTRLYLHDVNIVAATALEALEPDGGREKGLEAGANVVMTDLTPEAAKRAYALYPGKAEAR